MSWYPTPNTPWIENAPAGSAVVGHSPSIAQVAASEYEDFLLEVHNGNTQGMSLWYTLGSCNLQSTGCGNNEVTWQGSPQQYDEGYNPSVSIDGWGSDGWGSDGWGSDGWGSLTAPVVEVHQATSSMSDLWYHVGYINLLNAQPTVTWGPSLHVTNGFGENLSNVTGSAPSVYVADYSVVLVYQVTGAQPNNLFVSYGVIIQNQIIWQDQAGYANGYNPSVTLALPESGHNMLTEPLVVEAHQVDSGTGPLVYDFGALVSVAGQTPTQVTWTSTYGGTQYATGCYPSVGADYFGNIGELHSAGCGSSTQLTSLYGYYVP